MRRRTCFTRSSSAFIFFRCSAAGSPIVFSANTTPSSGSAWSIAPAISCLALFESNRTGFYTGLCLIALGSGGIKPCVAAFVGDQFDQTNKHRAKVVFDAFYWIINFGSFFASLLMPIFLRKFGGAVAFGIPGALMFLATLILWLGRKRYVLVPPAPPNPHSFLRVARTALASGRPGLALAAVGIVRRRRWRFCSCLRSVSSFRFAARWSR